MDFDDPKEFDDPQVLDDPKGISIKSMDSDNSKNQKSMVSLCIARKKATIDVCVL